MDVTDLSIARAGASLRIVRSGQADGAPIVFLHGGLGFADEMVPLAAQFAAMDCVLPETRGHGGSTLGDAPMNYTTLAEDAEAVITSLGLKSPVLVGHSDGGITALWVAARGRVSLRSVITLGGSSQPPSDEMRQRFFDPLTAERWRGRFPDNVARYESLNPEPDFSALMTTVKRMWTDASPGNYPQEAVAGIRVPTLILGGDEDHLISRAETVALAAAVPEAALGIVPGAGHMMHMEQPEIVAPLISLFLERAKT